MQSSSLLKRLPVYEQTILGAFHLSVIVPVYNEQHVVEASIRRLLALDGELISSLEIVIVDDCSTDGTRNVLKRLADEDERIKLFFHERNLGKGAAIRTAVPCTTGDIVVIHDADLEYNPSDIRALLVPFAREGADAVFGSRYLSATYRRALMYRHTLINKVVTTAACWFTDLALTDIETCYKAINATLLKSIPLRSNDFRFEVEIVFKLAKRRARVFEVPITYTPRSYEEGKKIRARDGFLAFLAMFRFWLIDDLYKEDEYGSHILVELERTRRFNLWMAETLRPYIGDRVMEIGAGIGNLTNNFIPRDLYVASDINPNYLHYLRSYSIGKPYLRVMEVDAENPEHFAGLHGQFDTVVMLNVLEHLDDEMAALRNIRDALEPGGRAVILVPQHPGLYGSLDRALGHRERYTLDRFRQSLTEAGFRVERVFDFNRFTLPGWWFNTKVLRRNRFSRAQLKLVDTMMPILKRVDRLLPWSGVSLIALCVKD
jgi:glycosyltransferase involved in cell wall biosynthesis